MLFFLQPISSVPSGQEKEADPCQLHKNRPTIGGSIHLNMCTAKIFVNHWVWDLLYAGQRNREWPDESLNCAGLFRHLLYFTESSSLAKSCDLLRVLAPVAGVGSVDAGENRLSRSRQALTLGLSMKRESRLKMRMPLLCPS